MPLSFRARLTLWYSVVLAALLCAAAAVLIVTLQVIAERRLDATLWVLGATEAEGTAARLRDRGLTRPDELTVHDISFRDMPGYSNFQVEEYVTVVTQAHLVADFSQNLPSRPLPVNDRLVSFALSGTTSFETADVPGVGRLRMIYILMNDPRTEPFVMIVGVPTSFVGVELATISQRVALIVVVILALAALSGWLLARRSLRPVAETAEAARRIGELNLHERLPEPGTRDEIGGLIKVFNELLSRLDLAFETQRRFTSDASHEIGTPLTVLKGNTEVALLHRHSPAEYEAILQSNLEEIERLSKLTSNLLVLARSDAGEPQVDKDIISLDEEVSATVQRVMPLAVERQVDLVMKDSTHVVVEADPMAVQQITLNLVNNALRYTKAGGSVNVSVSRQNGDARLEVIDTGVGIDPDDMPRIFDRFYRGGNARIAEPTGSGLGLAICQTLAKALGGRIEVESQPGEGSKFSFCLPVLD